MNMEQLNIFDSFDELKTNKPERAEGYRQFCGMLGAHNESTDDRETHDYYATEPIAAEWLCKLERLAPDVWEPACGGGHLAKVLEAHGLNVKATDLIDRGYGQGGVNFFQCVHKWHGDIVTNPPYSYAQEFIEHSLDLVEDGALVCMFLKLQFLEGQRRRELFETYPPRTVWVSRSRVQFGKNGDFAGASSMMATAWYVWEKGYKGSTALRWFK